MSKLEDAISRLTPEQRALLEMRLKKKRQQVGESSAKSQSIKQRSDQEAYPLSPNQKRILFLDDLSEGNSNYVITEIIRMEGPLEVDLLERAVEQVMERHESLRASFLATELGIEQTIHPAPYSDFRVYDLTDVESDKRLEQALDYCRDEKKYAIHISNDCLVRVKVLRLSDTDHFLLLSMHHSISDGMSMSLFFQELTAFYRSALEQTEPKVPELVINYADYADWMQAWIETEDAQKQRMFWAEKLEKAEELQVPTDKSSPSILSFNGLSQAVDLPDSLRTALQTLSGEEKITPFVLFLSAFKITLQRYSGQNELVVCSTMSGRRYTELENMVGYFNNLVALSTEVTDNMSLRAVLNAVTTFSLEANDNQELPFQYVADLPALVRTPLTRAFFTFEESAVSHLELPDITFSSYTEESGASDFYMSLFVRQKKSRLEVMLEYRTDLFSDEAIERFLKNYVFTLNCLVENLEQRVSDLPRFKNPVEPAGFHKDGSVSDPDQIEVTQTSFGNTADAGQPAVESLDQQLVSQLQEIWASVMGLNQIGVYDNFFDIGGHSLLAVKLFSTLEKKIEGFDLPLSALISAPTIARMSLLLGGSLDQGSEDPSSLPMGWSPLVEIQRGRKAAPMFCVHGAGGNILLYRDLAVHMGPDQTVYGLQAQGLDGKTAPLKTVEEMATSYVRAIRSVQPKGPYRLLGYCMGGTIALEMAQQLNAIGEEVELLALLETYNWSNAPEFSKGDSFKYYWQKFDFHFRNFMMLSSREKKVFFSEKWSELRRRSRMWFGKFIGSKENSALQKALAEVWKLNDEASYQYAPQKYPGRLLHFKPLKDYAIHEAAELNWQGMAREVETHVLPVYPAGMLVPPFVGQLAKKLREELFALANKAPTSPISEKKTGIVADLVPDSKRDMN